MSFISGTKNYRALELAPDFLPPMVPDAHLLQRLSNYHRSDSAQRYTGKAKMSSGEVTEKSLRNFTRRVTIDYGVQPVQTGEEH